MPAPSLQRSKEKVTWEQILVFRDSLEQTCCSLGKWGAKRRSNSSPGVGGVQSLLVHSGVGGAGRVWVKGCVSQGSLQGDRVEWRWLRSLAGNTLPWDRKESLGWWQTTLGPQGGSDRPDSMALRSPLSPEPENNSMRGGRKLKEL